MSWGGGNELVTFNCQSGWEMIGIPLSLRKNTNYTLKMRVKAPDYVPLNGYNGLFVGLLVAPPQADGDLQSQGIKGQTQIVPNTNGEISVAFNTASYNPIYLVLNGGYIGDNQVVSFLFSNIRIEDSNGNIIVVPSIKEWTKYFHGENITIGGGQVVDCNLVKLDYIEATGTQYINLGTTLNSNSKIEAVATYTSTSGVQMLYGAKNSNTNTALMIGRASRKNTNCYSYYNTTNSVVKEMSGNDWLQKHKYIINANKVSIDDILVKTYTAVSYDTRTNCYVFAVSVTGTPSFMTSARLHSMKVWQDGVNLTHNLIPVRDKNTNTIGLYDSVKGKLFTNSGTGTFIGG